MVEKIDITTEWIKLDQLLKLAGVTITGGQAKDFILSGGVRVNGEICIMRGKKIYDGDRIEVGNQVLEVSKK